MTNSQDFFLDNVDYSEQENTAPETNDATDEILMPPDEKATSEVDSEISNPTEPEIAAKTEEETEFKSENAAESGAEKPSESSATEKTPETIKSRVPKGATPPLLSLGDAVDIAQQVYDMAGGSVSFDAFSQVVQNSTASSSFAKKVTAMRNYGLVNTENKQITVSDLGENIVAPKAPQERAQGLKEAFLNVDIFAQIYSRFAGKILPQDTFLINHFKDLVPRELAANWMRKFKESAIAANLLFDRGDGKIQVVEDVGGGNIVRPTEKPTETADAAPPVDKKPESKREAEVTQPTATQHQNAIKQINLVESGKSVWIGTDANMFEIKRGRDLDFILALIKLFDEYENEGNSGSKSNENSSN
jgi:hypothetical protein